MIKKTKRVLFILLSYKLLVFLHYIDMKLQYLDT